MDFDVCIMHDRRRAASMPQLRDWLADDYDGPVAIADGTFGGPWLALKTAIYIAVESRKTHLIAVEDDAMLCRRFVNAAKRLASIRPDDVIHLFASANQAGREVWDAQRRRRSWCRPQPHKVIGNVGVIIPCSLGAAFLEWASNPFVDMEIATIAPSKPNTGDTRLWKYLTEVRNTTSVLAVPSLVQHADGPSLIGSMQAERTAQWWIGRDVDPMDMEWDSGAYL